MRSGDGPVASALLVRDGRVAAVGRDEDLRRMEPRAEPVNLHGGTLVPGFIDAHVHFLAWSLRAAQIDLHDSPTLDDALARITSHLGAGAPGSWLTGGRFDKNRWGRWPTAAELDRVTAGHPAALRSRDGHARWLNTSALRLAGIARTTVDPPGGAIERDERGEPTGVLKENANELIDRVIPVPDADARLSALRAGQREAWARGLVGVEDFEDESARAAFARLSEHGELGLRVSMGIPHAHLAEAIAAGLRTGAGGPWLATGHLKVFSDGALGSQTAALEDPYEGTGDRGILAIDEWSLARDVAMASAAGIAVAIHAIGDRAVRIGLDAFEGVRGSALPHRIEHAQLVREADLTRFADLAVIASMQPVHATSDRDLAERHWGAMRSARAYPWRRLRDARARLAFGSDAPVEPIDPLVGIGAAVTRARRGSTEAWHPEQRLALSEAIAAYTGDAAAAIGRPDLGSLAVGARCDATILEHDPAEVAPGDIADIRVLGTVTDGAVRHAAGVG